jgi:hypothetical protein
VAYRGKKLDGGGRSCDAFVIQRSGFQPLRCRVRSRRELRDLDRFQCLPPSVQYSKMGSVKLVRGAGEKVTADSDDVYQFVWSVVNGVHERQCPDVSSHGRGT